ncbi:hypothetical protein OKE80_05960 [Riemerella anatipestifer]|uniref:hypothetical protein n=1 Tax=Riemerella anatipestifer TaxID=34085 RepID=UPI0007EC34BD|nr:hypothetical protein [Riemerella anatipestifer]AZZ59649.1 hypothetical protein AWB57_11830 [Riemerella anatipestifer]MBT0572184.1 hypothetical protein [Riemerella anatipestifer]MCO7318893.1 hypothetical protein [Riemerella anatipestifer]MCQ4155177.1 hypothetical protein [Riemerella anatipestifer]MCQ4181147.1 hypothetical protein [Riemerella anatipestifer]
MENKNLKHSYENLSEKPSPMLWEKLEEKLEANEKATPIFSIKKMMRYAAVFLILVSLGGLLWKLNTPSIPEQHSNAIVSNQTTTTKTPVESTTENTTSQENLLIEKKNEIEIKPQLKIEKNNYQAIAKNNFTHKDSLRIKNLENSEILAKSAEEKKEETYVTADQLLFGREIGKKKRNQSESKSKLGKVDKKETKESMLPIEIKEPKEVEVLGVKIYSKEK